MNDIIALAITFILSISWLRIIDYAAQRGWMSGRLSGLAAAAERI